MHSGSRRGYFYAARFLAAHLFFIASLIRLRAAGDKWRLTPPFDWAGGRPGPRFCPCKAEIAALNRSRSASNSSMIVAVSMLLLGDNECTQLYMREQSFGCGTRFAVSCVKQHLAASFTAGSSMAEPKHAARRRQNYHERLRQGSSSLQSRSERKGRPDRNESRSLKVLDYLWTMNTVIC